MGSVSTMVLFSGNKAVIETELIPILYMCLVTLPKHLDVCCTIFTESHALSIPF